MKMLVEKKPVKHIKKYEKDFQKFTDFITSSIFERMENNTINNLNKSTIKKFEKFNEDAPNTNTSVGNQVGNYAVVFLGLAKTAKKQLNKQFSDERIEKQVRKILLKSDRYYQKKTYENIESVLGVPVKQLIAQEAIKSNTNALFLETSEWVKTLKNDAIDFFTNNSLKVMAHKANFDDLIEEVRKGSKKFRNDSKFVARNQLANFTSTMNKIRHQNLGFTKAIWVTSHDERVRASHKARNNKEYDVDIGLYSSADGMTLLPGIYFNCRCVAKYIYESKEE